MEEKLRKISNWTKDHQLGLFIFNMIMLVLVILRSAGYFEPFFPLTINFIMLVGFILCAVLLGAGSRTLFLFAFFFLVLSIFFKMVEIDVWAERSSLYFFNAIFVGSILLFRESFGIHLSKIFKIFSKNKSWF